MRTFEPSMAVAHVVRDWNNSMAFYNDSAIILENGRLETVNLGTDYLDCHKVSLNPEAVRFYAKQRARELREIRRKHLRADLALIRHHGPVTLRAVVEMSRWNVRQEKEAMLDLLKVRNFKSAFRKSLCEQVLTWFKTSRKARKYDRPLSPRQMESITRFVR